MNRKLTAYIVLVGVLTAGVLVAAVFGAVSMPNALGTDVLVGAAVLALAGCGLSLQQVYFGESNSIAMGTIAHMAALVLLPLPVALFSIAAGKILSQITLVFRRQTRTWRATIVNTAGAVIANGVAGAAFHLLRGNTYLWAHNVTAVLALPALASLAICYHVIDVLVVVGAVSFSSNDHPWPVFKNLFKDVFLPQVSLIFVGIIFAGVWHFSPVLSIIMVVPMALSVRSFEAATRFREETVRAVLRLAESIDYRDTGTYEHSKRLADLSRRLCSTLGLVPEHTEEIVLAARVHDLGKIGISNEILLKAGPLTPEQRVTMEDHPLIGASILESYSAFRSAAGIVRHHHERWDGKGYPGGLKGDEIPLGSRIVSIVDAFDSMTADRPYRKGLTTVEAVERLKAGMASQFDPNLTASFIQMLIDEGVYIPPDPGPQLHLVMSDAG